jgi:hypothetical protein
MLRSDEVAASLRWVDLGETHPLSVWCAKYEAGLFPPSEEHSGWDQLANRAMLDVALDNMDDPYCASLGLGILAWTPIPDYIDRNMRRTLLSDGYRRLCAIDDPVMDPTLAYWTSDAAITMTGDVNPAAAGELQMLAFNLGVHVDQPLAQLVEFYAHELATLTDSGLVINHYTAPARANLARHLRELIPDYIDHFLYAFEANAASDQCVYLAHQGRRQGVLYHGEHVRRLSAAALDRAYDLDSRGLSTILNPGWDFYSSYATEPLLMYADALFILGMYEEAMQIFEAVGQVEGEETTLDYVTLLRRVCRLTAAG